MHIDLRFCGLTAYHISSTHCQPVTSVITCRIVINLSSTLQEGSGSPIHEGSHFLEAHGTYYSASLMFRSWSAFSGALIARENSEVELRPCAGVGVKKQPPDSSWPISPEQQ